MEEWPALSDSIVERELAAESIFKDESKLSFDYVPPLLHHREEELKILTRTFRPIIDNPGGLTPRVIIRGQLGTGKTVLSRRFGMDFERYAENKKLNFKYIHVNCREEGSFFNILKNIIIKNFQKGFPHRGYSAQELLDIFVEILDRRRVYMILALDELEALILKEGAEPLFNLTRLYENRPPHMPQRISLVCIFREPECEDVFNRLDRSTLSTLGFHVVQLRKYGSSQLKDILGYRVREAFKENTVLPEAVELVADLAGGYGDARFAIELLWLAGKYADTSHTDKVYPEHVRIAQSYAHPSMKIEEIRSLSLHEKYLLLTVCRLMRNTESAYLPMSEVEREYQVICEEYRVKPRAHTQIWKYIKSLGVTGMVSTKISGKGQRGKTSLIGLYVSSEKLEDELLRMLT